MKKILSAALLSALAVPCFADMLAVKASVSAWQAEGEAGYQNDDQTSVAGSIALEHPIPIIPNFKLRSWDFSGNDRGPLELTTVDAIAYYEILDNPLMDFDIGIALTQYSSGRALGERFDDYMPQLYTELRLPFAGTGFGVYAEATASNWDDTSTFDIQGGLSYTVDMPVLDIAFQLGYRHVENDYDDFDNFDGKLKFSGATVGILIDL